MNCICGALDYLLALMFLAAGWLLFTGKQTIPPNQLRFFIYFDQRLMFENNPLLDCLISLYIGDHGH